MRLYLILPGKPMEKIIGLRPFNLFKVSNIRPETFLKMSKHQKNRLVTEASLAPDLY